MLTRRNFIKFLSCLPFAGLLGLSKKAEEPDFDTKDAKWTVYERWGRLNGGRDPETIKQFAQSAMRTRGKNGCSGV